MNDAAQPTSADETLSSHGRPLADRDVLLILFKAVSLLYTRVTGEPLALEVETSVGRISIREAELATPPTASTARRWEFAKLYQRRE